MAHLDLHLTFMQWSCVTFIVISCCKRYDARVIILPLAKKSGVYVRITLVRRFISLTWDINKKNNHSCILLRLVIPHATAFICRRMIWKKVAFIGLIDTRPRGSLCLLQSLTMPHNYGSSPASTIRLRMIHN